MPGRQVKRQDGPPLRQRLGRWLWRLGVVALVVSLALVGWLVYQSPLLQVRSVSVTGAQSLDPAVVADVSGLKGQNIIRADTAGAKSRLLSLSAIKSVSISRRWPGRMVVHVDGATALGLLAGQGAALRHRRRGRRAG